MKKHLGFTLIELMIVVAVIAILAAVALTSYRNQVLKSKRGEAKQVLSDIALRQEKYRLNNATYSSTLGSGATGLQYFGGPGGASNQTPTGYYTIALSTPGASPPCPGSAIVPSSGNSFRITATTAGDQQADTKCATLVLTSLCGTVQKTATGDAPDECW